MSLYPQRPGEPNCRDFLRTGRCKYGESCKYHHPEGGTQTNDPNEPPFPIRPDEPLCQYYLKNGTCKFGQACKFHHPPHLMGKPRTIYASSSINVNPSEMVAVPNEVGLVLPQRPAEPDCLYFLKHGRCKYGSTCKYHHPMNTSSPVNVNNDPVRYAMYAVPNTTCTNVGERARSISTGF